MEFHDSLSGKKNITAFSHAKAGNSLINVWHWVQVLAKYIMYSTLVTNVIVIVLSLTSRTGIISVANLAGEPRVARWVLPPGGGSTLPSKSPLLHAAML